MKKLVVLLTILLVASYASAEITVPPGFVVDTLLDQIDGQIPRLEAIRNSNYGFGFGTVTASIDNNILKVLKISISSIEVLATKSGYPLCSRVLAIRFDKTGIFSNHLYISVDYDSDGNGQPNCTDFLDRTDILKVTSEGDINIVASKGNVDDRIGFIFDFTTNINGYNAGMYLEDINGGEGSSFYYASDSNFDLILLCQELEPVGRTDMDIWGMEFDPTGLYDSYLTMVDSDDHDELAVIYQLDPNLSWTELTTPVNISTRFYRDMTFSNGGSFGQALYVTDRVSESVMSVDPNGVHTVFISGFSNIESISLSGDNEHMFLSDENGIYRIRSTSTLSGPTITMQEPKVENGGVHINPLGVDNLRLLFNERVIFDNSDVSVTDANDVSIPSSVSGSNSQFMIIVFGEILKNNVYTITVSDTVLSAETGNSIDGDKDGLAGGDAIIGIEHRKRSDFNNDNDVDFNDLANFAMNWLWHE